MAYDLPAKKELDLILSDDLLMHSWVLWHYRKVDLLEIYMYVYKTDSI